MKRLSILIVAVTAMACSGHVSVVEGLRSQKTMDDSLQYMTTHTFTRADTVQMLIEYAQTYDSSVAKLKKYSDSLTTASDKLMTALSEGRITPEAYNIVIKDINTNYRLANQLIEGDEKLASLIYHEADSVKQEK